MARLELNACSVFLEAQVSDSGVSQMLGLYMCFGFQIFGALIYFHMYVICWECFKPKQVILSFIGTLYTQLEDSFI